MSVSVCVCGFLYVMYCIVVEISPSYVDQKTPTYTYGISLTVDAR